MIDLHSHYLHQVDDGAKDIDMSLDMVRMAINEGITGAVLTPHYYLPRYHNSEVQLHFDVLKARLLQEGLSFDVYLGNELHLDEESVQGYMEGKVNTMNGTDYVLVELPFQRMYPFHLEMIHQLQIKGAKVILAHIDRYEYLCEDVKKVEDLRRRGLYFQINADSIRKRNSRKSVRNLMEKGLVDLVATDTHRSDMRVPKIADTYDLVSKWYGDAYADSLYKNNPQAVVEGREIQVCEAERNKKWGIF